MYGLVNRGVQDLITRRWGDATWRAICAEAQVDPDGFIAMRSYPDALTYRLVAATAAQTGLPAESVLEAFGESWVLYTGAEGYGPLMNAAGTTFPEFLRNLDALHTRVAVTLPALSPPSFVVEDEGPCLLRVHYHSHRPGLAPLVIGLLKGLARRFDTPIDVQLDRARADGNNHDEFLVRYG